MKHTGTHIALAHRLTSTKIIVSCSAGGCCCAFCFVESEFVKERVRIDRIDRVCLAVGREEGSDRARKQSPAGKVKKENSIGHDTIS